MTIFVVREESINPCTRFCHFFGGKRKYMVVMDTVCSEIKPTVIQQIYDWLSQQSITTKMRLPYLIHPAWFHQIQSLYSKIYNGVLKHLNIAQKTSEEEDYIQCCLCFSFFMGVNVSFFGINTFILKHLLYAQLCKIRLGLDFLKFSDV